VYQPLSDTSVRVEGVLCFSYEVTEQVMARKVIEENEIKTTKDLDQSNEDLRQFAYVASHDLQEPLRKIIMFSIKMQDAYKKNKSEEVQSHIKKIIECSERMTKLINDLLDYSHSVRDEKNFEKVDLNHTIKEVVNTFEAAITEIGMKLKTEKLPVIEAIPVQMTQLFQNLISNAFKFTKRVKSPAITISSRALKRNELPNNFIDSNETNYVDIIIHDNGIGFDEKFADQIFVIFQRLHDKQTYPGTGIGLALCKKIVVNHNGYIYAESNKRKGTSFHVILPLKHV
jgi:two-component system CheB/CheR fusion protein